LIETCAWPTANTAAMERAKLLARDPPGHRAGTQPQRSQLPARNHPLLSVAQLGERDVT